MKEFKQDAVQTLSNYLI